MKSEKLQERATQAAKDWFLVSVASKASPTEAFDVVAALRWYSTEDAHNCRALAILRRDQGQEAFDQITNHAREEKEMSLATPPEAQERNSEWYMYCPVCRGDNMRPQNKYDRTFKFCPICGAALHLHSPTPKPIPYSAPETVRKELLPRVTHLIAQELQINESEIQENSSFMDDLGADSLAMVELLIAFEEKFKIQNIDDETAMSVKTVGDAVNVIAFYKSQGEPPAQAALVPA